MNIIDQVLEIVETKRAKAKANSTGNGQDSFKFVEGHIAVALSDLKSQLTKEIKYRLISKEGFQYQTKFRSYEDGIKVGNCFAACVANILGLEIEDVPNVETLFKIKKKGQDGYWLDVFMHWLDSMGYYYEQITEDNPPAIDELYLAAGHSGRGVMHSVVYKNGQLHFDPYPGGNGLIIVEYFSVIRKK